MKNWLIILLAAACVILSVRFAREANSGDKQEKEENTMENAAYENIMTRSSVRSYTDQEVADSVVEKLLRAGMAAPTAVNKQPWEFIVVNDTVTKNKILESSPNIRPLADAPLAIVVCGNLDLAVEGEGQSYWIQDCSAATENILLAANALGLGAVWCGIYPIEDRVKSLKETLQIPENIIPLNVICIGYPEGKPNIKDKWKPERIHYGKYTDN